MYGIASDLTRLARVLVNHPRIAAALGLLVLALTPQGQAAIHALFALAATVLCLALVAVVGGVGSRSRRTVYMRR